MSTSLLGVVTIRMWKVLSFGNRTKARAYAAMAVSASP